MSLGLAVVSGCLVLVFLDRRPARPVAEVASSTVGSLPTLATREWVIPVGLGITGLWLASPGLVVAGPVSWRMATQFIGTRRSRRLDAKREAQVLAMVDQIGHELRSGQSLARAFTLALENHPLESAADLDQLTASLAAGERLEVALGRLQTSIESLRLLAIAVTVLVESGGPASVAIGRLADTLRARQAAHDETRTQASQATASAAVLAGLPLVFGFLLAVADHRVAVFYAQSLAGAVCLGGALGLVGLGWTWMDRLVWS